MSVAPWLEPVRAHLAALRARGAHAALVHGPAGIGKWDLVMSFAREVLCESPRAGARACGECASCLLLAAGNHPDLRVVVPDALAARRPAQPLEPTEAEGQAEEPASGRSKPSREIKIDQVRELSDLLVLSAHRGGARVVALGPAEALNLPAANALLKSLEEPPPGCLFLLVSDQIDRCLPTVLSRCALLRAPLPPREQALQWLASQGIDAREAASRLTEAGGAPLLAARGDASELEPGLRQTLVSLLRRGRALAPADVASELPRTIAVGSAVALFQRWAWDYFSYRLGGALRYHPAETAAFEALAGDWSLAAAARWADGLRDLRAVADHPLNARAAIEGALLQYCASFVDQNLNESNRL